jgi:hypothetical protein
MMEKSARGTMSEQEGFITISANGMQPDCDRSFTENVSSSQINSRNFYSFANQSEETCMNTPLPRTHDTSRSVYHLKDITEFAAKLHQVRLLKTIH